MLRSCMLPLLHNTRLAAYLNDDWSRCVSELVTSTGCITPNMMSVHDNTPRVRTNDIFLQNALDFLSIVAESLQTIHSIAALCHVEVVKFVIMTTKSARIVCVIRLYKKSCANAQNTARSEGSVSN